MNCDIILISGKQGSGKTTTSTAISAEARKRGYDFISQLKFATPLYILHDYLLNKMEGLTGIKRVEKDGDLLQILGTDWGRNKFGSDVWVNIVKREIHNRYGARIGGKSLVIIDDCRFPNEFYAFEDALRVRLEAREFVRRDRTNSWRGNTNHPSEIALDDISHDGLFDLYISTEGSASPETCAQNILDTLERKNWKHSRPQKETPIENTQRI